MIPQIFVSHASEDKKRLEPYVSRLLDELKDVLLWIDTPEKIKAEYGHHPRIKRIVSGDDWERSIGDAIEDSSCVLVFWSAKAIEHPRIVMWREVIRGIEDKKCLLASIDPLSSYNDQTPASTRQKYDISELKNQECAANFEALIAEIKLSINRQQAKASVQAPFIHVEGCQLPFLVDRQPQIAVICRAVDRMNQEITQAKDLTRAAKPLLFIVPGLFEDATDMFAWRLTARDGPQYCNTPEAPNSSAWLETFLPWPTNATSQNFVQWFSDLGKSKIGDLLGKSKRLGLPACFWTTVWQADIEKSFRASVEAWIQYWNNSLPAPTLDPKAAH